jgi:hypothetical protein
VLSFSEALWEEARDTGVHVSCPCPGPTVSNFRQRAGTDKKKLSRAGTPMSSASVAELGYRGWKANKRVEVTGLRNRVLAAAIPFVPRKTALGILRGLQSPLDPGFCIELQARPSRFPRVDELDSAAVEVGDVPGNEPGAVCAGDRRNLRVEMGDRPAQAATLGGHARIQCGRIRAKTQHATCEILGEHRLSSSEEP